VLSKVDCVIFVKNKPNGARYFSRNCQKCTYQRNWTITHDPYLLETLATTINVDLGAEKIIAAQRDKELIAVEIKSFLGNSYVYDFHLAVGQYMNYMRALKKKEPHRKLILAVPQNAYKSFFSKEEVTEALYDFGIHLLVFDDKNALILKWINP
jgi:hypothetical protein